MLVALSNKCGMEGTDVVELTVCFVVIDGVLLAVVLLVVVLCLTWACSWLLY